MRAGILFSVSNLQKMDYCGSVACLRSDRQWLVFIAQCSGNLMGSSSCCYFTSRKFAPGYHN